jgi:CheY-like chemotaxis protein
MTDRGQCILVAEDDRFLRKAAETTLGRSGFTVLTAQDGEEALRLTRERHPDLVLLDLLMPKASGAEVLRALKADPMTADIPVVVFSNLGYGVEAEAMMAAGAAGYVIKADLSLQELVQTVDAALRDRAT